MNKGAGVAYMKNKCFWISLCIPYDKVRHAGGKICNYYLKGLQKSGFFDIRLMSFCQYDEIKDIDLSNYNIVYEYIIHHHTGIWHLFWASWHRLNRLNLFHKNGGFLSPFIERNVRRRLKSIVKTEKYQPDIIVLQWTEIVLMIDYVKEIFPGTPIVCIEEDVSYLGYKRKIDNSNNIICRLLYKSRYRRLKKSELACLKTSNMIVLNNKKDEKLLHEDGIYQNTWTWVPFYDSYLDSDYSGGSCDVIYYGAMNREENWKSVIWFIDNVLPRLNSHIRLVVIGNRPPEILLRRQNERVIITGFVDSVEPYFSKCLCLVAPLVLGAGIKIKVIEAMSAGVPVLTNSIGIEGIDAVAGEAYIKCVHPEDYVESISAIEMGIINSKKISSNAKEYIRKKWNYQKSLEEFNEKMIKMVNNLSKY